VTAEAGLRESVGANGRKKRPGKPGKPKTVLTPRQREVLQLIAEGHSNKQIAGILHISEKTAEFHKASIMRVLGLRSTAQLTKFAIKHGLTQA
jgi:DNA-binding NarL/FixJ family response regulator